MNPDQSMPISLPAQRRRRLFLLAGASVLTALTVGTLLAGIAVARLNKMQGGAAGSSSPQPASISNSPGSLCP
jgi:hypothetical protein